MGSSICDKVRGNREPKSDPIDVSDSCYSLGIMLKGILLVIGLCATLTLSAAEPARAPVSKHGSKPEAQKTEQAPTVTISKLIVEEPPKAVEKPKGYRERLFSPESLPNIILCVVGLIGIPVAIRTLIMLQRQTGAMQDTLDVSKRTLLLQFRPNLIVRDLRVMGLLQNPKYPETKEALLDIENIGGSDAHITDSAIVVKLYDYTTAMYGLMDGAISLGKMTLAPGQNHVKSIPTDDELEKAMVAEIAHGEDPERSERKSYKSVILCSGNINYVDDLNITRTLRLSRRFNPVTFEFAPINDNDSAYTSKADATIVS
jgi:hypothetical protein